jgi:hypothetical protein
MKTFCELNYDFFLVKLFQNLELLRIYIMLEVNANLLNTLKIPIKLDKFMNNIEENM